MCLHDFVPPAEKTGYKLFLKTSIGYASPFVGFASYELGKWYTDHNTNTIAASSGERYPAGFHIFKTLQSAKKYLPNYGVVVKVKYRHVLCKGRNYIGNSLVECVIARDMMLVEEVK